VDFLASLNFVLEYIVNLEPQLAKLGSTDRPHIRLVGSLPVLIPKAFKSTIFNTYRHGYTQPLYNQHLQETPGVGGSNL
jgi:hypothetical protein